MNNYFLLGWTANLGVVPLLRFSALRVFPDFFFLFSLFVQVIRVLETITNISARIISNENKAKFVPSWAALVKAFIGFFIYSQLALGIENQVIYLAKGEQHELTISAQSTYSVGNPQVLKYQYNAEIKGLLLKAQMIGYTDLVVRTGKKRTRYEIYVLPKKDQLRSARLRSLLESEGLIVHDTVPDPTLTGEVKTLKLYSFLQKLIESEKVIFHGELSPLLEKEILGEIYKILFENGLKGLQCRVVNLSFYCTYQSGGPLAAIELNFLKTKFGLHLENRRLLAQDQNFQAQLEIFAISAADGESLNFGLSQLKGEMLKVLHQPSHLLNENIFELRDNNTQISTLATPKFILRSDTQAELSYGSEIPFQYQNQGSTQTEWKFAGLKLKIKLKSQANHHLINYEIELTTPKGNSVSGTHEKSSVTIPLNQKKKIFELDIVFDEQNRDGIPLLQKIPVLGKLFEGTSLSKNYKKIIGIIKIEEK